MSRYILIDNASGYIWGDSADIGGKIVTGTPVEVARVLDKDIGEFTNRTYQIISRSQLSTNETGYIVYRADINGSEAVPLITDGQSQEQIETVINECEYECTILCLDETEN
jgi:hypothetical protein